MNRTSLYVAIMLFYILPNAMNAYTRPLDQKEIQEKTQIIIDILKKRDKKKLSDFIKYPLTRSYPLADIENKNQFIQHFEEIFDKELIAHIVNSDNEKDWEQVGSRGIMLDRGFMWLNIEGFIISVPESKSSSKIKRKLIEKERKTLNKSIKKYKYPIIMWKGKSHIVRIDYLENGFYRYASWSANKKPIDKPDIILSNGTIQLNGTLRIPEYTFENGSYSYIIDINKAGEVGILGSRTVLKDSKQISHEDYIEDLKPDR